MGGPHDSARFEAPGGETKAFHHLQVPTRTRLPLPRMIGRGVFGYVVDENVVRGGVGPWYYCDGQQWNPISGAGSGPYMWDYLVDKNWATEVAAGRGTEGQVFTTFHGHTFKVYSTVQAAITDGQAVFSRAFSIFVVGGTTGYTETMDIASFSHEVHILGSGFDSTRITAASGESHLIGNTTVHLSNLTLDAPAGQKALRQKGGTLNMRVHATRCHFLKPMAGDHAGSEFYGCDFEQGWVPDAGDTPTTVTLIGGALSGATHKFDFQTGSIGINQWKVLGFRVSGTTNQMLFYTVDKCEFDLIGPTGGDIHGVAIFGVNRAFHRSVLRGQFNAPSAAINILDFSLVAGVSSDGSKIIATFANSTIANTGGRFLRVASPSTGVMRGWHVDLGFSRDGAGNFHEDKTGNPPSVEIDCEAQGNSFTLHPHDKAKILADHASNSDNVVHQGVIASGSVGVAPAPGTIIVQEDDVTVEAAATTLDFTEPDAPLVTSSPAGEANINMALYALLAGRAAPGQTLHGSAASGADLTLKSTSHATKGTIILDEALATIIKSTLELFARSYTIAAGRIVMAESTSVVIVSPESGSADSLASVQPFSAPTDGVLLLVLVKTGQTITVKHDDTVEGAATFRFYLNDGSDLVVAGGTQTKIVPFVYRNAVAHWVEWDQGRHALVTLAADADTILSLTGQELGLDTQSANRVWAGPTSGGDADPTFRALVAADIPVTTIFGPRHYENIPDAAVDDVVVAGDAQGKILHAGPADETAVKLYVDAETAPGASGLPVTWQYGDTDDLDTVASWTTIATLTLSSEKSANTPSMTNATVPANRLIRTNWGSIVGSPANAGTTLRTKVPLST